MPERHFPVAPDLGRLGSEAHQLLRDMRRGEREARSDLTTFHPDSVDVEAVRLADAQLVLARSYGLPGWLRLEQACEMIDAIRRDDPDVGP